VADFLAGWVSVFSAYVKQGRCDLLLRGLTCLGTRTLLPDQALSFALVLLPTNRKQEEVSLAEDSPERARARALTAWLQLLACFMSQAPPGAGPQAAAAAGRGFPLATEVGFSPVNDPRFVLTGSEFTATQHGLSRGYEQAVADRLLFSSCIAVETKNEAANDSAPRQRFDRLVHVAFKSKKMKKTARANALARTAVAVLQQHFLSLKPWRVMMARAQVQVAQLGGWSFAAPPADVAVLDLELLYTPLQMLLQAIVLRDASVQHEDYCWNWLNTNQTRHQHWRRVLFLLCQLRCKALRKYRQAPLVMSATFDEGAAAAAFGANQRQAHAEAKEELYCLDAEDLESLVQVLAFLFALAMARPSSDMVKSLLATGDSILARARAGDAPCAWHRGIALELLGLPTHAVREYEKAIKQGVDTVDRAYNAEMLNLSMLALVRLRPRKYDEPYGVQAATYSAAKMLEA